MATAFAAGSSVMGMALIGIGIYAGINIRNRAYSAPQSASSQEVFNNGRTAANDWPTYLNSYRNISNWQHPLDFGKGLKQARDEQAAVNVRANRPH